MMTPDPTLAHDRLTKAISDLVLSLRIASDDLAQAEPTAIDEIARKLSGLDEIVRDGSCAVAEAVMAYECVAEEPERGDR